MKQEKSADNCGTDDNLTLVYCSHCGTPLGRIEDGARYGVLCTRCKKEYVVSMHEDSVTQIPRIRQKPKLT